MGCSNIPFWDVILHKLNRVTKLLTGEFSDTICSVSLHPSRIMEHLMFFKKSLMDATYIPCGVTDAIPRVLQNNLKCDISPTKKKCM